MRSQKTLVLLLSGAIMGAVPTLAEQPERGRVEVVGFGGINGGLPDLASPFQTGLELGGLRNVNQSGDSGTKWQAGGGIGVLVAKYFMITGEFAHDKIADINSTGQVPARGTTVSIGASANINSFTAGGQFLIPVRSRHAAPYVGAALGVARTSVTATTSVVGGTSISATESDLTTNVGGGMRLYFTDRFGIRPDFRVIRLPGETYYRATVGVFYQFR